MSNQRGNTTLFVEIRCDGTGLRSIGFDFGEADLENSEVESKSNLASSSAKKTEDISAEFTRLSASWVRSSIAFFESVPKFSEQNIIAANNDVIQSVENYAKSRSIETEILERDGVAVTRYRVMDKEFPIIAKRIGVSSQAIEAAHVMGRSALGALLAEYEHFMLKLLRILARNNSKLFISDEHMITMEKLSKFETIEDARSAVIEEKIESLIQTNSHVDLLKWIEKNLKVNLSENPSLISEFSEVCQRRHLFTHAGGIVNRRYLEKCNETGVKDIPEIGTRLGLDKKYLRRATARVFQVGFFTMHILWQKIKEEDSEKSLWQIVAASHDFLENDLTKMCRRICDFVIKSKTKKSRKLETYLAINKALSFKFDTSLDAHERHRGIEQTLDSVDWSVTSPSLDLALACVRSAHENIYALAEAASKSDVDYYAANTWVVFREVRDLPGFLPIFEQHPSRG